MEGDEQGQERHWIQMTATIANDLFVAMERLDGILGEAEVKKEERPNEVTPKPPDLPLATHLTTNLERLSRYAGKIAVKMDRLSNCF